jgi:hypothetical protein
MPGIAIAWILIGVFYPSELACIVGVILALGYLFGDIICRLFKR